MMGATTVWFLFKRTWYVLAAARGEARGSGWRRWRRGAAEPLPDDAPAVGVAAGARHQARGWPLLAVAGDRPPLDPRRLQGSRPRHRRRHGGLLPGDPRRRRGRPHRLPPALPRLPPSRVYRCGRLREVRGAGLLGGRASINGKVCGRDLYQLTG